MVSVVFQVWTVAATLKSDFIEATFNPRNYDHNYFRSIYKEPQRMEEFTRWGVGGNRVGRGDGRTTHERKTATEEVDELQSVSQLPRRLRSRFVGRAEKRRFSKVPRQSQLPSYFGRGEFAFLSSNLPSLHSSPIFFIQNDVDRPTAPKSSEHGSLRMCWLKIVLRCKFSHFS